MKKGIWLFSLGVMIFVVSASLAGTDTPPLKKEVVPVKSSPFLDSSGPLAVKPTMLSKEGLVRSLSFVDGHGQQHHMVFDPTGKGVIDTLKWHVGGPFSYNSFIGADDTTFIWFYPLQECSLLEVWGNFDDQATSGNQEISIAGLCYEEQGDTCVDTCCPFWISVSEDESDTFMISLTDNLLPSALPWDVAGGDAWSKMDFTQYPEGYILGLPADTAFFVILKACPVDGSPHINWDDCDNFTRETPPHWRFTLQHHTSASNWCSGVNCPIRYYVSYPTEPVSYPELLIMAVVKYPYPWVHIASTLPTQNELNVSLSTNISVTFDVDMDETTINDSTFVVNARSTGLHQGTITYDSLTRTATLDPLKDFDVGEVVTVVLTTDIQSAQGIPLDSSYIWFFTAIVHNGCGKFSHSSNPSAGDQPRSIFAADLDDDGDLDLAIANQGSDNVSVLFNDDDGNFVTDSVYSVGSAPVSVFAADLDGDGDLDLTTVNTISRNLTVLMNNGDSTFTYDSAYGVGVAPTGIFAADLNGDSDLDLVATSVLSPNVQVLLNNGDGTFTSYSGYLSGKQSHAIFVADLDSDGDLDLATANWGAFDVSVLLNNGDGTFAHDSDYSIGVRPGSIFAADLDADGDLDLATANGDADNVSVLLNNGDGSFVIQWIDPAGDGVNSVFAADLDGDGDLDLATANGDADNVSVLLNNGNGTFATHSVYTVGSNPFSVFAADLDGDGDLDLATANSFSDDVSVLLNQAGVGVKEQNTLDLPKTFSLSQNYPNPFNPVTQVKYALPRDCWVRLQVYNILGQKVATLVDGKQKAGHKAARWNATSVTSGIYFYRLQAGDFVQTRKMVLLK